jgi:hypothetical protein
MAWCWWLAFSPFPFPQAMNASPFVKPFKERASTWETLLQTLQDMLDNWLQCQVCSS